MVNNFILNISLNYKKNRFSYGFFTHTNLEAFSDVLAFMVVGSAVPAAVAEKPSIVLTRCEP